MGAKTPRRVDFGKVVRAEMKRQGLGTRTLARRLVGPGAPHNQVDNMRGQIKDWISVPPKRVARPESRRRVARALGISEQSVLDQEADLLADLLRVAKRIEREQRAARAGAHR